MNPDPDKQDELQKMLALKRHETPPARFFKGFPQRVRHRLHSPVASAPSTGWRRLGLDVDAKPVLVCASAVVVCGLLLVGLIASLRVEPAKPTPLSPDDRTHLVVTPPPSALAVDAPPIVPMATTGRFPRIGDPVVVSSPLSASPINPQLNRVTPSSKPTGSE